MVKENNVFAFNKPDAEGLVTLIDLKDREHIEGKVRGGGGSSSKIFQTPGGGIAARSGTTAGSATCTEYKFSGSTLVTNTNTLTVYNIFPVAIPASYYVIAHREAITSQWVAVLPGIVNLRLSGNDLQYTIDGTNWTTWTTGTTCA